MRLRWRAHAVLLNLILLSVSASSAFGQDASTQPPNIVFLFADDLGYGDLACYGHPLARTPRLDQLAQEGTRFSQFYVTGVTCNPSRTGLMTGLFPARFPKYAADFGFGDRTTVTALLKQRGYATGHFGKWHIGPDDSHGTYGIDTVHTIGKSRDAVSGRDDDLYSAAIDFIRANKERPFYVNVWGHATHYPVNTPRWLADEFENVHVNRGDFAATMQHKFDESLQINGDLDQSMRQYLGDVLQVDLNVGRILDVIDDLGLRENTIVVFSSDHGPAPVILASKGVREYSSNMLGYAAHLRGGKHTQYEGGVRVPFIVRWPGQVRAGQVDDRNVGSFIDWLPTICSIAGITELPDSLDGEDISDMWMGTQRNRGKPLFWKTSAVGSKPAMRAGRWKLHMQRRNQGSVELYDLELDPSESRNVAHLHPDMVVELRDKLDSWVAELPVAYQKAKAARKNNRNQ